MIPAPNIYYLLCYAWDWLEGHDLLTDVDAQECDRVQDLLAMVLTAGTAQLLRRGIDRTYVGVYEEGRSPRGKISIAQSINRALHERGMIAYVADELSADVLPNQLIAATLRRLTRTDLDARVARDVHMLARRFPDVTPVVPGQALFRQVRLHRNNASYRFVLRLCELIAENLLPVAGTDRFAFRDFTASPQDMGLLFQEFVRKFLEREQRAFRVSADHVRWDASRAGSEWLPQMQTDVMLTSADRKIVVELKYPGQLLQTAHGGSPKLHSSHLYQLLAYLKNLECAGGINRDATGVLLYAATGQHLDLTLTMVGHSVLVRALDLTDDWRQIRGDLLDLVDRLTMVRPFLDGVGFTGAA